MIGKDEPKDAIYLPEFLSSLAMPRVHISIASLVSAYRRADGLFRVLTSCESVVARTWPIK